MIGAHGRSVGNEDEGTASTNTPDGGIRQKAPRSSSRQVRRAAPEWFAAEPGTFDVPTSRRRADKNWSAPADPVMFDASARSTSPDATRAIPDEVTPRRPRRPMVSAAEGNHPTRRPGRPPDVQNSTDDRSSASRNDEKSVQRDAA